VVGQGPRWIRLGKRDPQRLTEPFAILCEDSIQMCNTVSLITLLVPLLCAKERLTGDQNVCQ